MSDTKPRHVTRRTVLGLLVGVGGRRIVPALVLALALPASNSRGAEDARTEEMERVMTSVYQPGRPGAAVIAVKDGKVIFRRAYGLANLELQVPMRPEMTFRICSVTKQFTAAAILMLAEEHRLALSDEISKYLPNFRTGGAKITIENLLTHTSGIPDYLNAVWPAHMTEPMTPQALLGVIQKAPIAFVPGSKADYSNSNYVLLGAILEKVSGEPYGSFIERRIFATLGMTHSCYERPQRLLPNRVSGYVVADSVYLNAAPLSMSQLYAAGALCSSADDLARWDAAIDSGKLLSRASWDRMFTPYRLAGGDVSPYASGWAIGQLQGKTIASHAGGIPGFRAFVLRAPSEHLYVALLSNDETTETQPEVVARRLAAIALGQPIQDETIVTLDETALQTFVGRYVAGSEALTVRRHARKLFAQDPENPEVELFPVGGDVFVIKAFDARVTFVRDSLGSVTALIESMGGQDLRLKKVK